jgi:hypothetical protein
VLRRWERWPQTINNADATLHEFITLATTKAWKYSTLENYFISVLQNRLAKGGPATTHAEKHFLPWVKAQATQEKRRQDTPLTRQQMDYIFLNADETPRPCASFTPGPGASAFQMHSSSRQLGSKQ